VTNRGLPPRAPRDGSCSPAGCPGRTVPAARFVKLAQTIEKSRPLILNTLDHGLSNARVEATNTHLRILTRRAYGYHSPDALIAMAMLTRGGLCPTLPGRPA
jgi:transposase